MTPPADDPDDGPWEPVTAADLAVMAAWVVGAGGVVGAVEMAADLGRAGRKR